MTDQTTLFFTSEATVAKPGSAVFTFEEGFGTTPNGTNAQFADNVGPATYVITASDLGYRTSAAVDGDPIVYAPIVTEAFALDRRTTLDPSATSLSAAWGAVTLYNADGEFNSIISQWVCDSLPITIKYGFKTLENFSGLRSNRNTVGTYIDSTNTLQTAPAFQTRQDYTTGLPLILNEAAATNSIRNPRAEGSAVGTPGTMPTNWTLQNLGVTSPVFGVVGTGFESGIPYVDLSLAGTLTASGTGQVINFEPVGIVAALTGQVWRGSLYYRLMSGALPSGSVQIQATELTSAGATVTNQAVTITSPTGSGLQTQKRSATLTLSGGATTAFIRPNIKFTFGANLGVAFSFTIRVGGVQYERGSVTTSLILPAIGTPLATTRTADNNYSARGLLTDPAYGSLVTMLKGLQAPWFLNDTSLIMNIRDATYWLSRPVQPNQYSGSGGYNGTASLAGVPIPKARGGTSGNPICNVTPTLIDPVNQIYQYSDSVSSVVNLYEGGAATITRQSDVADLYVGSTTAGQFRTSNARGMFQLGSAPVGSITCDVTGQFPSNGVTTSIMQIIHFLLTEDLLLPAANISASHYTTMAGLWPYTGGVYFSSTDSPDGITAISRLLIGIGGKLYPARDGTLKVLMLRDPVTMLGAGVVAATFDQSNTISVIPQQLPTTLDPPPYRMRVNYSHNYTVQTTGLLGAATAAHKQFIGIPDQFAAASSSTVLANYSRPNDPPGLVGSLLIQSEASTVATALVALWGVRRRIYAVSLPVTVGLLRDIGDFVTLRWPMDDLGNGKVGIVVGDSFRSGDATITFTILI